MKTNHAERPLESHPIVEAWDSIELLEARVSALEDAVISYKDANRLLSAMNATLIGIIEDQRKLLLALQLPPAISPIPPQP